MQDKKTVEDLLLEVKNPAVYQRVSTNEQETKRQQKILGEYIQKRNLTVSDDHTFVETESAYRTDFQNRKKFMKLLEAAEQKEIDSIIVSNADRISRQTLEHFKLRKLFGELNIPVIIASNDQIYAKSDIDQLVQQLIEDGMTKLESDNISVRTKDTLKTMKSKGKYAGGGIPYGYKPVKHSTKRNNKRMIKVHNFEQIDDEIMVIKRIFNMFQGAESFRSIAKVLSEERADKRAEELKDSSLKKSRETWTERKVRGIITNPFYTGHLVYNRTQHNRGGHTYKPIEEWEWVRCDWINDPPISKKQWLACWEKFQGLKDTAPYHYSTSFCLTGKLVCHCGKKMRGKDQRTKSKKTGEKCGYRYYICACGTKVKEDSIHAGFLSYFYALEYPLTSIVTDVNKRFVEEWAVKKKYINKLKDSIKKDEEILLKLKMFDLNNKMKKNDLNDSDFVEIKVESEEKLTEEEKEEEKKLLEEEKTKKKTKENLDIAWFIANKRTENSLDQKKSELLSETKYLSRLEETLADYEEFMGLIESCVNEIRLENRLLRALVLLMVKNCKLITPNQFEATFYMTEPKKITF
jgi:site-specific DNA recombinase